MARKIGDFGMNRYFFRFFILVLTILIAEGYLSLTYGGENKDESVRNSILAGSWYPGNKNALTRVIRNYLSHLHKGPLAGELKAIIVPHAGYRYSGQVAAYAYKLLEDKVFNRVVMIGPSHRVGFRGVSVNLQSGYRTPLGLVPVDQDFGKKIFNGNIPIQQIPQAHKFEHSLEIQIPFLQTVLQDFHIVPILMVEQNFKTCNHLARRIVEALGGKDKTLLLASTDLSHFHDYDKAKELDYVFLSHVRQFDPKGLADSLLSGRCEACGGGPAITVMLAAQALGANRAVILKYANSGDVTGNRRRVVGYLAAALIKTR